MKSPEFVTVAKVAVPVGGMAVFDINCMPVAVASVGGTFPTRFRRYVHARGMFPRWPTGSSEGTTVTCPCHPGEFDVRTGEVLAPPPSLPVRTYRVRIEGEKLKSRCDACFFPIVAW